VSFLAMVQVLPWYLSRAKDGEGGIKSCHMHSEGKNKEELTMKGFGTQHWIGELLENGVIPDIHFLR